MRIIYLLPLFFIGGCLPFFKVDLDPPCTSIGIDQALAAFEKEPLFSREKLPASWWKAFGEEALTLLVEQAIADSPTLQAAADRVEVAGDVACAVRAQLLPSLYADGSYKYWQVSKDGLFRGTSPAFPAIINLWGFNLDFSFNFDVWGRYRAQFDSALEKAAAALAEFYQARLLLSAAVSRSYFDLKTALMVKKELLSLLEVVKRDDALRAERFSFWIDPKQALLSSQIDVANVEKRLYAINGRIEIAKAVLKELIGAGQDCHLPEISTELGIEKFTMPIPEELSLGLLRMRPDLAAQICIVQAAGKDVYVAKTSFYPNFSLTAASGLESIFTGKIFNVDSVTNFLLPAFLTPIYTGGLLTAELAASRARYATEVAKYEGMVLSAASNVMGAIASLRAIDGEIDRERFALEKESQRVELIASRFDIGIDNEFALLEEQKSYLELRIALISLLEMDRYARVNLFKELGGGYE